MISLGFSLAFVAAVVAVEFAVRLRRESARLSKAHALMYRAAMKHRVLEQEIAAARAECRRLEAMAGGRRWN